MYIILNIYSEKLEAQAIVNESQVEEVKDTIKTMYENKIDKEEMIEILEDRFDINFCEISCLVL